VRELAKQKVFGVRGAARSEARTRAAWPGGARP
jgi:hypothetical protein